MKNLLFLLGVTLVLALGYACKKNDVVWPVAKNTGSNVNVNPGDSLDSVAVFTVAGNAFPADVNTMVTVLGKQYPSHTYYYFTVTFSVFAVSDIDYTSSLYSSSYTGRLNQKFTLDSNAMQVAIPIHYNKCIQRSSFQVSYTKESITPTSVRDTVGYNSNGTPILKGSKEETFTFYQTIPLPPQPPGSGAEANGSGNCESFTKGIVNDTTYMIFSQTGSAILD